jgi:elongation factor Ts
MVRVLREKTGAGMMDCKKALTEAEGDLEKAVDELRKRGQAIADKKAARGTKEGLIFTKVDGKVGVLVEIGCETDFVARNEEFRAFGQEIADMVHADSNVAPGNDVTLLTQVVLPSAGKVLSEALRDKIAKIGENMAVSRVVRVDALSGEGPGYVQGYIHPPGKLGVLLVLRAGKTETFENPAVQELARDLAMQIAAAAPAALTREAISPEQVARERAIYAESEDVLKKPENIREKIIDGKLAKFYKESCLLEQQFVKDPDITIKQLLEKIGKQAGDTLTVTLMERFAVGGGQPAA